MRLIMITYFNRLTALIYIYIYMCKMIRRIVLYKVHLFHIHLCVDNGISAILMSHYFRAATIIYDCKYYYLRLSALQNMFCKADQGK